MIAFLYVFSVFALLIFLMLVFLYITTHLISSVIGVPFVKTPKDELETIFLGCEISHRSQFFELGSGTAAIARHINHQFGCKVTAIEANPALHFVARLQNWHAKQPQIGLIHGDAFQADLSTATHVYFFMLPEFSRKIADKLQNECKKGTVIITYGFKIPQLSPGLIRTLTTTKFSVFYYRL